MSLIYLGRSMRLLCQLIFWGVMSVSLVHAQGVNLWGHYQSSDMDQTWGQGAQMTFSNPAGIVSYKGWGFSYDLQAFSSQMVNQSDLNDSESVDQLHQVALSTPIWGSYQSSLGFQGGNSTYGTENKLKFAYRLISAHAFAWEHLSIGFAIESLYQPQIARYSFSANPANSSFLAQQREHQVQYSFGLQWKANSWLAISSMWRHLNHFKSKLGDYSAGLALRPFNRWTLGFNIRPVSGMPSMSTHTRLRLWKGLALEFSYDYQDAQLTPIQALPNPTHTMSFALAWLGQVGWRAAILQRRSGDHKEYGYALSLRFKSRSPQKYQLFDIPRTVILPLTQLSESQNQISLLQGSRQTHPFLSTLVRLQDLSTQKDVSSVLLVMNQSTLGWAQAEELSHAIHQLKKSGKWVYIFAHNLDHVHYLVASQADSLWTSPTGSIAISGLLSEQLYIKNLLDHLHVKAEFLTAGDYKSAPEIFTRTGPSPQSQKVNRSLLDQKYSFFMQYLQTRYQQQSWYNKKAKFRWQHRKSSLKKTRSIHLPSDVKAQKSWQKSPAFKQIKQWLDQGPYSAQEAYKAGLVDVIVPAVKIEQTLKRRQYGSYTRLSRDQISSHDRWPVNDQIAVIHCVGDIGGGLLPIAQGQRVSAQALVPIIQKAMRSPQIKGVVLRIDSPGGAVSDADEIWQVLSDLAKRKPLAVSMGNMAASGGYYIASAAHKIFANAYTLTGSIGVFAGKVDLSGVLKHIGVDIHRQKRGKGGGSLSVLTPWSEKQRAHLQKSIDQVYTLFLQRILKGRKNLNEKQLKAVAGGRVWTGLQAKKHGLIDEIGGILDAISWVAQKASLQKGEYTLRTLSVKTPSLLRQISNRASISSTFISLESHSQIQKLWQSIQSMPQWKLIEEMPHISSVWIRLLNLMISYPSQALVYAPVLP
jgi:protease IV